MDLNFSFIFIMSVDIFGRSPTTGKEVILKGPPGVGFLLTDSGNFDIGNKRLCNVSEPEDIQDAINLNEFLKYKKFVDTELKRSEEKTDEKILKVIKDINNRLDTLIISLEEKINKSGEKQRDSTAIRNMLGIWK